ncbi:hypothetical protein Sru01_39880 [Sphaerisporangium rufum]|uniref:Uncharacterized protein n=1 Tax=Sphaerisporangium rufum TaxID=1381558 RepID=A0A919R5Y1_9ACTN|nr:hypothetical protein Sru01_39880 [Sphaerisporangium rufum]
MAHPGLRPVVLGLGCFRHIDLRGPAQRMGSAAPPSSKCGLSDDAPATPINGRVVQALPSELCPVDPTKQTYCRQIPMVR